MDLLGKRVLVIGLARTGIATVKALCRLGALVTINDLKKEEQVIDELELLKDERVTIILGSHPEEILDDIDLVVPNPGVPLDMPLIVKAFSKGIEVISEVELAYRLTKSPIIGITGTNGKTTTTTLIGELLSYNGNKVHVVGNIGVPMISVALDSSKDDYLVCELSSYQLEGTVHFKPKISLMLNLTPDHLSRHKTIEGYLAAKSKIFTNQTNADFLVINYDDLLLLENSKIASSNLFYFSRKSSVPRGTFIREGKLYYKDNYEHEIISVSDIVLPGNHNLENVLAAVVVAKILNVPEDDIRRVLMNFNGVEHRLEKVATIKGVTYINDSKATNPEAAIKALEAISNPIVLIAGGDDKGSDYTEWIKMFDGKVKELVLIGKTRNDIRLKAIELSFEKIKMCSSLQEAVNYAYEISEDGDYVLLSPGCASYDMFDNFEQRGNVFKLCVKNLKE